MEQALPTATIYSATKGAVDTLTRVLAAKLGPRKRRGRQLRRPFIG